MISELSYDSGTQDAWYFFTKVAKAPVLMPLPRPVPRDIQHSTPQSGAGQTRTDRPGAPQSGAGQTQMYGTGAPSPQGPQMPAGNTNDTHIGGAAPAAPRVMPGNRNPPQSGSGQIPMKGTGAQPAPQGDATNAGISPASLAPAAGAAPAGPAKLNFKAAPPAARGAPLAGNPARKALNVQMAAGAPGQAGVPSKMTSVLPAPSGALAGGGKVPVPASAGGLHPPSPKAPAGAPAAGAPAAGAPAAGAPAAGAPAAGAPAAGAPAGGFWHDVKNYFNPAGAPAAGAPAAGAPAAGAPAAGAPADPGFWQSMKQQAPGAIMNTALMAGIPLAMNAFSSNNDRQQQY